MSKGPTRNTARYKVGGGHLNEFEFNKNQGEMTEQFEPGTNEKGAESRPQTQAERVVQLMAQAHRKVEEKRRKKKVKSGHAKQLSAAPLSTETSTKLSANRKPAGRKPARSTGGNATAKPSPSALKTANKSSKRAAKK